jgi:hypothetical protein
VVTCTSAGFNILDSGIGVGIVSVSPMYGTGTIVDVGRLINEIASVGYKAAKVVEQKVVKRAILPVEQTLRVVAPPVDTRSGTRQIDIVYL